MLTAKVKDGSSSNITSSSESTPPVSEQLSRPVNEIMMNPSDSTKDNADKVLPAMPAPDKAESGDIEMPKKDPSDKPSLTMEELIEQSK